MAIASWGTRDTLKSLVPDGEQETASSWRSLGNANVLIQMGGVSMRPADTQFLCSSCGREEHDQLMTGVCALCGGALVEVPIPEIVDWLKQQGLMVNL